MGRAIRKFLDAAILFLSGIRATGGSMGISDKEYERDKAFDPVFVTVVYEGGAFVAEGKERACRVLGKTYQQRFPGVYLNIIARDWRKNSRIDFGTPWDDSYFECLFERVDECARSGQTESREDPIDIGENVMFLGWMHRFIGGPLDGLYVSSPFDYEPIAITVDGYTYFPQLMFDNCAACVWTCENRSQSERIG